MRWWPAWLALAAGCSSSTTEIDVTLGTLDGANIELRDAVGPDNFFLFGLGTDDVARLRREGYRPGPYIERSERLREVLAFIESGFFSFGEPDRYRDVTNALRNEDRFLVCADFDSFSASEASAAEVFRDPLEWSRRALLNIAGASRFSADDTIRKYASEVWGLRPEPVSLLPIALEL